MLYRAMFDTYTALPYMCPMFTVAETEIFSRYVVDYWSEEERGQFAAWIAEHSEAGAVVPGSGGCRKVRWARAGMGKRGGVRVIYYNILSDGVIWLLLIYGKGATENVPAHLLKAIKEEIEHA